jgi:hypothetical protein
LANKKTQLSITFTDRLVLFKYFLNLFGKDSLSAVANKMKDDDYEGYDENNNTRFYSYLVRYHKNNLKISADKLRTYDENIVRYVRQIGDMRGGITLKYFQYLSLLFTEIYLDRYFSERNEFINDLNSFANQAEAQSLGQITYSPFNTDNMNKIAFMSATGSGKTLIMHANILQYIFYLKRAQRIDSRLQINKIILLAPNEGMSLQHKGELELSSIKCGLFEKSGLNNNKDDVIIIDMNKLKEEGKVKTVSIDSFEQNNLVLVDEGHRGMSGDVWYDYRTRLSAEGFAFEYSATFKQALKSGGKVDNKLMDEYGKSIIMDYSYKFFHDDGYGKEYRIFNLKEGIDTEQRQLYLTGCLLSFYQQLKVFETYGNTYSDYFVEKPLLVFVGNRVTASTSKAELTDVEEVLSFIDKFVNNKAKTVSYIGAVMSQSTGLIDGNGNELFFHNFHAIDEIYGHKANAEDIYYDILKVVFNTVTSSSEPRLHIENIKQVQGEIALKIGNDGEYFGVISIGDTATLVKNCDEKGIVAKNEEFVSESLFRSINSKSSNIKILIGSRKFTEGWNSWRVSTMGLINFAKGEGSQAIQLFGRGVRLKGYNGCLKRSNCVEDIIPPRFLECLEMLTIFGIKADYMTQFREYLLLEEMPANDNVREFKLPVLSRFDKVKGKNIKVIKLKYGANFKKQSARLILSTPDEGFEKYLIKNKTSIDCRSKVQTIESTSSFLLKDVPEEHQLSSESIQYLDYDYIYSEIQRYKNEKTYYNICLDKKIIKDILLFKGWYSLIIPKSHLIVDSIAKLEAIADFSVLVLKSYVDKFYKYQREKWEAPLLEYQELKYDDNNFVSEYTFTYTEEYGEERLEKFLATIAQMLNENGELTDDITEYSDRLTAFDFRNHLYAPLICLKANGLKLQISPVSLNEGEKKFVDLLKAHVDGNDALYSDKQLFLLRNKSKVGMGFFEAGNFYPDYVLWINAGDKQYITFIDPKGLMNILSDNPKISFFKKIKELQERLQPTSQDKEIILNSFIMSDTPSADLKSWWNMSKVEREEKNVYCLDNEDCVDCMIEKILIE